MKKVTWGAPNLQNPNSPYLKKTKTFKELWEAGQKVEAENRAATEYLHKAYPAMEALLKYKLEKGEPLVVMRPLRYQTSEIEGESGDAIDKSFYGIQREGSRPRDKFVDITKTILPGTVLMLKALDMSLQEFIFKDGMGNEHCLNFSEKNNLLTQTSIFEEVRNYLETKGE